jgi:hypothetical protein
MAKVTTYPVRKPAAKKARMAWNSHPFYPGSVPCPECGAEVGEGCANGSRTSHDAHPGRVALHLATYDAKGQPIAQVQPAAEVAHQEEPKAFASPLLTRCPTCRAEPGHPCKNYKGQRCQTHASRIDASKIADQAQAAQVAKVCDEVAASFALAVQDSRPVQADLFAAPECRKPTRPAPQATEPAPLFAKVSP